LRSETELLAYFERREQQGARLLPGRLAGSLLATSSPKMSTRCVSLNRDFRPDSVLPRCERPVPRGTQTGADEAPQKGMPDGPLKP